MTFFLWTSIFSLNKVAFGYSREQMIAYVFLVLIVSAFVTAAPSNDNVGGEISNGDLNGFLIKPIGYLRYWLTRDWSSKLLNISFAVVEIVVLWTLFRPHIALASNYWQFGLGIGLCIIAALLYFVITKIAISIAFWAPEDTWGFMFIIWVCMETLSGMVFPLDILPQSVLSILNLTPFPYLVYYPIAIMVGRLTLQETLRVICQAGLQLSIYYWLMSKVWKKGLKNYSAYGG